jgi:hypothetical protein
VPRGLLAGFGLGAIPATVLHFLGVQTAAMVVVPKTTDSPPAKEWPKEEIAIEAFHHLVYATAAGAAYAWLTRSEKKQLADAA